MSTLVGMVCPGLHSLFAAFSIEFLEDRAERPGIGFRVRETDERFRMMRMEVFGSGVSGSVQAFLRWPPVAQASAENIAKLVAPTEFSGSTALIIGGSRGLGALTAKIIAAGGGRVIITYATGRDDASTLAREINVQVENDVCKVLRYDVREDVFSQLAKLNADVTHLYYFATPQITRQKTQFFIASLLDEFIQVYVKAFYDCYRFFDQLKLPLTVYYPSTVFVESKPPGMAEYSMAKMMGEILCSYMNGRTGHIHVIADRLPRLLTDQTATLPPLKSADPLEIMLPVVRRVQSAPAPALSAERTPAI
ncbi:MAG TPA: SDR family oxidoreductase [Candidatus Binataceae bacterium]|nr:SDR family oxidoreductase [Candidatus Binataceae bacterium]